MKDENITVRDGEKVEVAVPGMVLDDTFGRWVQELDGRQVLVVLDTCHSGGQTQAEVKVATAYAYLGVVAARRQCQGFTVRERPIGGRL
mgnify:CR=1 FL=1